VAGSYEDVGLRATLANINQYLTDAKKVDKSFSDLGRSAQVGAREMSGATASMMGALKPLIGLAALGIAVKFTVDGLQGSVGAASDLNETINKSGVIFGDAAADVQAFADTAAKSIGVSKREAVETAATFGALFTNVGLGQGQAAKMAISLEKIAADLGSLNNQDPSLVLMKLRSGLVGEAEPLRALNILLNEERTALKAVELGLATSTGEVSEQAKVQARYASIIEQATYAQNDFANTSTGMANASRIVNAALADEAAIIGQEFLPISQAFTNMLAQGLPGAFEALDPVIKGVGQSVRDIGTEFIIAGRVALEMVQDWDTAWSNITSLIGASWDVITASTSLSLWEMVGENTNAVNAMLTGWYDLRDRVLQIWHDLTAPTKLPEPRTLISDAYIRESEQRGKDLRKTLENAFSSIDDPNNYGLGPSLLRGVKSAASAAADIWKQAAANREAGRKELEAASQAAPFVAPAREMFTPTDTVAKLAAASAKLDKAKTDFAKAGVAGVLGYADIAAQVRASVAQASNEATAAINKVGKAGSGVGTGVASGAKAGQESLKALQEEARATTAALRDAENALRAFSDPRLVGMQGAEDEMFNLEQQIKQAELRELGLGDAGKTAAKEVKDATAGMGDGFDLLAAQQRELAEGIPVPFQRAMYEIDKAKEATAEPVAPPANDPVKQSESDRLQRLLRMKQLQYDITFDPQKRALKEIFETLTGANDEITFDAAVAGMNDSYTAAELLKITLGEQEDAIKAQQDALETQKTTTGTIAGTRATQVTTEGLIKDNFIWQNEVLAEQKMLLRDNADAAERIKAASGWSDAGVGKPGSPEPTRVTPGGGGPVAMAEGGDVARGGWATVGERGPEPVYLPAGARVLPHSAMQSAQVNRNYTDTYNIYGSQQPIDVWHTIQSRQRLLRMAQGRG
jgi:hypothetical protein